MAKLFSSALEAKALRSMCSKDLKVAGYLLSNIDETYFHLEESQEVHARILDFFNKKGEPPSFKILCEDVRLSEEAREFLADADKAAKKLGQAQQLTDSLNRYRQTRLYYKLSKSIHKHLENPKIDTDELQEMVAKVMAMISLKRAADASVFHIGKDSNTLDIVKDLIYAENTDKIIPTGFDTYDRFNGGFLRGSLVLIGGTSGGGKSIVANQLNINQSRLGYKSLLVPLEMAGDEMLVRTVASSSGINSLDILLKKAASGEKDKAFKRFKKLDKKIRKAGGRYTIFKPKEDLTIEELLAAISSYKVDIVYIDYIGLLKDADGDDQWRKLGQIARFAKQWADIHNKVVVLLAQINEEGKLRYSQMVKEHTSLGWFFVANKQTKESGWLHFEQPKSRNQSDRPFSLKINYAKMKVSDPSADELKELQNDQAKKAKKTKGEGVSPDLTE